MHSLEQKFNEEKNKLKQNILNVQPKVSFTMNMWSANCKDFLGVTVHFVDNNFTLKSSAIGIKRMHPHRGKEIAEFFKWIGLLQIITAIMIPSMNWEFLLRNTVSCFLPVFKIHVMPSMDAK